MNQQIDPNQVPAPSETDNVKDPDIPGAYPGEIEQGESGAASSLASDMKNLTLGVIELAKGYIQTSEEPALEARTSSYPLNNTGASTPDAAVFAPPFQSTEDRPCITDEQNESPKDMSFLTPHTNPSRHDRNRDYQPSINSGTTSNLSTQTQMDSDSDFNVASFTPSLASSEDKVGSHTNDEHAEREHADDTEGSADLQSRIRPLAQEVVRRGDLPSVAACQPALDERPDCRPGLLRPAEDEQMSVASEHRQMHVFEGGSEAPLPGLQTMRSRKIVSQADSEQTSLLGDTDSGDLRTTNVSTIPKTKAIDDVADDRLALGEFESRTKSEREHERDRDNHAVPSHRHVKLVDRIKGEIKVISGRLGHDEDKMEEGRKLQGKSMAE